MARYNEILTGRFNRAAQKLFSMKGPASVVSLSDELMPVHQYFSGAENRYGEGHALFMTQNNVSAVAANNSLARFRNPAGTKVAAVFSLIALGNENAATTVMQVSIGAQSTDLAGGVVSLANTRVDNRVGPSPSLVFSIQNSAPLTTLAGPCSLRIPMAASFTYQNLLWTAGHELCILPGDCLQLQNQTVNQSLTFNVIWRERVLEDSELL